MASSKTIQDVKTELREVEGELVDKAEKLEAEVISEVKKVETKVKAKAQAAEKWFIADYKARFQTPDSDVTDQEH